MSPRDGELTKGKKSLFLIASSWCEAGHMLNKLLLTNDGTRREIAPSSGCTLLPHPRGSGFGRHSPAVGCDSGLPPLGNAGTPCCFPRRYRTCSPAGGIHSHFTISMPDSASGCSSSSAREGPAGRGFGRRSWGLRAWDTPKGMSVSFRPPPLSQLLRAVVPGR